MADQTERALAQLSRWATFNDRIHTADEEAERALSEVTEKVDALHDLLDKVPAHVDGEKPIEAERRAKQVAKLGETLDKVIERAEHLVAA
jgi:hypothetical protein